MVKRFLFLEETIRVLAPKEILDIGCGNGYFLTVPLAARFQGIRFFGVDTDWESIKQARSANTLTNLEFSFPEEIREGRGFDLIIASEVIEHVEDPGKFLESLKGRLNPGGRIFLSMPNGYGPFEISCFLEAMTYLIIVRPLKRGKQALLSLTRREAKEQGINTGSGIVKDTCALSPHINFFSYKTTNHLIENAGLRIINFRPRTFLCGYLFDRMIRSDRWISWNARVADRLPKCFASDWMFMLEVNPRSEGGGFGYHRSACGRLRRWVNLHRLLNETACKFR
jgi:2-polyprenyl-3-methyl-5-hydroxy-6-metoxy-1,4-benzoquinol methylase